MGIARLHRRAVVCHVEAKVPRCSRHVCGSFGAVSAAATAPSKPLLLFSFSLFHLISGAVQLSPKCLRPRDRRRRTGGAGRVVSCRVVQLDGNRIKVAFVLVTKKRRPHQSPSPRSREAERESIT